MERNRRRRTCKICGPVSVEIHLHRFPQKPQNLRIEWAKFCGIDESDIKKSYRLCDLHFQKYSRTPTKFKRNENVLRDLPINSNENVLRGLPNTNEEETVGSGFVEVEQLSKSTCVSKETEKKKRRRTCKICGPVENQLFKFPEQPEELRIEWAKFCVIDESDIKKSYRLCDLHFEKYSRIPTKFKRNENVLHDLPINTNRIDVSLMETNENAWHGWPINTNQTHELSMTEANPQSTEAYSEPVIQNQTLELLSMTEANPQSTEAYSEPVIQNQTLELLSITEANSHTTEVYSRAVETVIPSVPKEINLLHSTEGNNSSSEQNETTSTEASSPTVRYFRYFGDIKESDVDTPRRARLALRMAREVIATSQRKLQYAEKKNERLTIKNMKLESQVAELEAQNLLSKQAALNIII